MSLTYSPSAHSWNNSIERTVEMVSSIDHVILDQAGGDGKVRKYGWCKYIFGMDRQFKKLRESV